MNMLMGGRVVGGLTDTRKDGWMFEFMSELIDHRQIDGYE